MPRKNKLKITEEKHMKDYDIKIKKAAEVTLYATDNDTIVVPSKVKFDTDRDQADIDIEGVEKALVGIPPMAGNVEVFIENAVMYLKGISFERLEIDAEGKIQIVADQIDGNIDINMLKGEAELIVPEGFVFATRCEGKNNEIRCEIPTDPSAKNTIELNGKNSVLTIRN